MSLTTKQVSEILVNIDAKLNQIALDIKSRETLGLGGNEYWEPILHTYMDVKSIITQKLAENNTEQSK